jgi:hypothetical protein
MVQKLVIRNEVVKVKGRVKVITIKKEEFDKFLKLTKLRILDKEYNALMPPLDNLQKNTIDVNGLATLIQQYMTAIIHQSGNTSGTSPAQMVITTSTSTVPLSYTGSINPNSQGVTVYIQVFQESGNYTFQYFYIGFDTTDSSYTTSQIELYVSAYAHTNTQYAPGCPNGNTSIFTNTVRIAYTSTSFTKTPDSYLFIVWLIEFQNIPPYLLFFTPTLQNNLNIEAMTECATSTSDSVYFNNGKCNLTCGGNCPSAGLGGFVTFVQNNNVILEFPLAISLGAGVSSVEVLLCTSTSYINMPTFSGSISTTIAPPVSGATFYVVIATITITYQAS